MSVASDRVPIFNSSLSALARVAFQETQATGFALFRKIDESPGLLRVTALGAEISQAALIRRETHSRLAPVRAFPLHTADQQDGLLAFSFHDHAASARAQEPLHRLREAFELIWSARHQDALYSNLLADIGRLEAQLIDSRIADRAQGLLTGERDFDLLAALVNHVKTVVRPDTVIRTLESMRQELQDEMEERRVTGEAKALLQAKHSLSENQAYTHLRLLSRKSRRPLKDVAMDVIATSALTNSAA